jgi:malto-oligosyltrehalose synthase/4-alpha-glucanotransferase
MLNPVSTYRLQLNGRFTFSDLDKVLSYLHQLGVGTLYASPILAATPGSTHGYDGVDPHRINPEIGTQEQLLALSQRLNELGIHWLQDLVPNHMAFHPANQRLMDVLEKGPLSRYADWFDLGWTSPLFTGRPMVPFLGEELPEVIRKRELELVYRPDSLRLYLSYHGADYPLHPRSYARLLQHDRLESTEALGQLIEVLEELHREEEVEVFATRWEEFLQQLAALYKHSATGTSLRAAIEAATNDPELMSQLAGEQEYRLCHWQETDAQINYRRFFTVNGLICLNMQLPAVFEEYHRYLRTLLEQGILQGIRIDHVDGLFDPTGYLQELRKLVGKDTYVVVEKILEHGEELPTQWPVQGATGYEFLADVNNLFTNKKSEEALTSFYTRLVGNPAKVPEQILEKKAYILHHHMAGELDNLHRLFLHLGLAPEPELETVEPETLKRAIGAFLVHCPVYRYYGNRFPLEESEQRAMRAMFGAIRARQPELVPGLALLEGTLLLHPPKADDDYRARALLFYQRCMQFTGPLMAKGVEDTLMYTYNRFLGHNEVGDAPDAFGITSEEFHRRMADRLARWPLALNATTTHDTKRGEDARARLNVLTDLAEEWLALASQWQQVNAELKANDAPDANDEYLIYQSLLGALPGVGPDEEGFRERFGEYLQKALREAKRHSAWGTPNEAYEAAAISFATGLLNQKSEFWKSFAPFHQKVAEAGIVNSLAQVLLKGTCPGVPDFYQGTEFWDFSLVDPDNRRPVDYDRRQQVLAELQEQQLNQPEVLWAQLWESRHDARIKLWLTHTLLLERRRQPDLFAHGKYLPLTIEGTYREHVLAFVRSDAKSTYLVAVPLHTAALCEQQGKEVLRLDWQDTRIMLPAKTGPQWQNVLTGTQGTFSQGEIKVGELFSKVPFALLKSTQPEARASGLLLHITSLPSAFGVGDLGPEAYAFADFLARTRQSYWQLLPLNPTEAGQGHSPYSATSSRAGNPLLISPELLAQQGLLDPRDLQAYQVPCTSRTDYTRAGQVREVLLEKAWQHWKQHQSPDAQRAHEAFCRQEADWLDDFALYTALKKINDGRPWYEWPEEQKQRGTRALDTLRQQEGELIEKTRWLQYVFHTQWTRLKRYCNRRGIRLFGDMPFYTSYDSVDVWAHRAIFKLDEQGQMTGIAGVPPDFFSEEGQLWGMPVFDWEVLREQNYDWWIGRLRKNTELFDLVRLDHFRAFADYWVVPAGETTAKNGEWQQGPGLAFFEQVRQQLGSLPFVAEDLGDISEEVLQLRQALDLPGMKVLLFAFDEQMPQNTFIPHHYTPHFVAYTGTHDNNTSRGWVHQEGQAGKPRLEQYLGRTLTDEEVPPALCRLALASVARLAVLPVQDLLGLDEAARMNYPGAAEGNWQWRLLPGQLGPGPEGQLREWTLLYDRS